MRPLVLHLADKRMRTCFEAFFSRTDCAQQLGCAHFEFDPTRDIFQAPGITDPGTYQYAHENLAPYLETHQYAMVVLDEQWDPSPGAEAIAAHIGGSLKGAGWVQGRIEVVVIRPELEVWMWTSAPALRDALRYAGEEDIRQRLCTDGLWPEGLPKPLNPKGAFRKAMAYGEARSGSVAMRHVCASTAVGGCQDLAFQKMRSALQRWFPVE